MLAFFLLPIICFFSSRWIYFAIFSATLHALSATKYFMRQKLPFYCQCQFKSNHLEKNLLMVLSQLTETLYFCGSWLVWVTKTKQTYGMRHNTHHLRIYLRPSLPIPSSISIRIVIECYTSYSMKLKKSFRLISLTVSVANYRTNRINTLTYVPTAGKSAKSQLYGLA